MSAFKQIALYSAQKSINTLISTGNRQRKVVRIDNAQSVLILFDARSEAIKFSVAAYIAKQTNQVVHTFCLEQKDRVSATAYSSKETNWADIPKPSVVKNCQQITADLLILFNPDDLPSLHYLAIAHQAGMKVSTASQLPTDADLVFDMKGNDFQAYAQEVEQLMKNILV
jgi:hypothetical protein